MIYIFDIDGTFADQVICNRSFSDDNVIPMIDMINAINILYERGNRIVILTGRGSTSGIDWRRETEDQLKKWGLKYHELKFIKKPDEYTYIDDRAMSPKEFWESIEL